MWRTLLCFAACAVGAGFTSIGGPSLPTVATMEQPHARAVAFSPDGALLAVAAGSEVRFFRVGDWAPAGPPVAHGATVSGIAFFPGGEALASVSWDGTIRVWDVASRGERRRIPVSGGASDILALALSPDGKMAVLGCVEERTKLGLVMWYDPDSGRLLRSKILSVAREIQGLAGKDTQIFRVRTVQFNPDGTLLAAGSEDRTIRVWDRTGGEAVATLTDHPGRVYALAFRPDGHSLAAASWREVVIWDVATWTKQATLPGHRNEVWTVAYSPDGALLASGAYDGYVRLWDAGTLALVSSERVVTPTSALGAPLEQGVLALAFSPDGRFLAAVGSGGRVFVWEVRRK